MSQRIWKYALDLNTAEVRDAWIRVKVTVPVTARIIHVDTQGPNDEPFLWAKVTVDDPDTPVTEIIERTVLLIPTGAQVPNDDDWQYFDTLAIGPTHYLIFHVFVDWDWTE